MKSIIRGLCLLTLLCGPLGAEEIKRMSLDDAAALGTTIQTDLAEKTEGRGSVRITTRHPTTVCIGEVEGLDVENARLVYAAAVKSDLAGSAYLEMWAFVGQGQYFSKGLTDPIEGKSDWKTLQTPFLFKKGQRPKKVTLNLVINGRGTVWIDEVRLHKKALDQ